MLNISLLLVPGTSAPALRPDAVHRAHNGQFDAGVQGFLTNKMIY